MAWTPPTRPDEAYELSPFGFGPFPLPGQSVEVAPPHPQGGGYGGVGFIGAEAAAGTPAGLGAYGSRWFGRPRLNILGGYGGDPYGLGGYGGVERTPPYISSAISISPLEVEVYFSEELDTTNPALTDPASYTLEAVTGAAPATVVSAHIEKRGSVNLSAGDTIAGVVSVVLIHSGTTLGGTYRVHATNLTDIAGNPIIDANAAFLARGAAPHFVATAIAGDQVRVNFSQDMLRAVDEPGAGPGISDTASYEFTSTPDYPIDLVATAVDHDLADAKKVLLTVQGMTSLGYSLLIGPSFAYSYDPVNGLDNAVRVDTGTGTAVVSGQNLVVGRAAGNAFGLEWQDTSGTIVPLTSTLRMDLTYDFSNAAYSPAITLFALPEVVDVVFQDGLAGLGVLVRFTLQYGVAGVQEIRLRSGTYDVTVEATWTGGPHTLSFVRNQKADTVTFLLDDYPLASTAIVNVDGTPETQAGTRFTLLNGGWSLTGVRVREVRTTSSTTVYSQAWNFMHEGTTTFEGSDALTRDTLLTQRGPLVKGWGDATPATAQDVTVVVNGAEVEIHSVNPYVGAVRVAVPIPLLPPGHPQADVKVDYQWFKAPIMEFAGLNTDGLVLNKFDCPRRGHHDPASHGDAVQTPTQPKGAVDIARFPMGVVLGPMTRAKPIYIGHRYMGFERAASALINSPTTLVLNQAPGRASVPGFERTVQGVVGTYEGLVTPQASSPAWALSGTDYGGVDHSAETGLDLGTYTLIDAIAAPFDLADGKAVVYHRGLDQTYPSAVTLVARFQVASALFDSRYPKPAGVTVDDLTLDGVFTGVGFGIHNNNKLYLCGILKVNGVEHVGLLLDPKRAQEVGSWVLGPKTTLTASKQNRGSLVTASTPVGFVAGSRFQVLSGAQAGVYTATSVVVQTDGTTTVEFTPEFPATWDRWGQKYIEVVFETRVTSKPFTYRLDIHSEQQVAELRISGETQGIVVSLDGDVPALPAPALTSLLLPMGGNGQVFWGSLSRQAASRATWSFMRYGLVPDQVFLQGHSVLVNTEMTSLPENDTSAWFPRQDFGTADLVSGDTKLLLKSGVAHPTQDFTFGYTRIEPFFSPDALFDYRAKFALESGTLGAGDVELLLDDTQRVARLVPLLYQEGFGGLTDKRLVNLPAVSTTGFSLPETLGWTALTVMNQGPQVAVEGAQLVVTQTSTERGGWVADIDWDLINAPATDEGRLFEARLAVVDYTTNGAGDTGIRFGCQAPGVAVEAVAQLELRAGVTPGVRLRTAGPGSVQEYDFDWTDGEPHTYRVVLDRNAETVTVILDDAVQLPVADLNDFDGGTSSTQAFFGCFGLTSGNLEDPLLSCTVEWHHFHCQVLPPLSCLRTLGVWLGGDKDDINSYEIPRTDSSTAPNSWETGPVIEEMDWRSELEVRVLHDPGWGITVFRPDLPSPPYYQPEDGVAGHGFITESNAPSAGWINVEYTSLPRSSGTTLGVVSFGSLDSRSLSQSRWDWVRYRMFQHPMEDRIAPEHMLLNQFNVITSGERTVDVTLERVVVQSLDWQRVTLLPVHMYAESIYKILDGDRILTSSDWSFDTTAQLATLVPTTHGVPQFFGQKLSGSTGGGTLGGSVFTDTSTNFSSLVAGDYLHILYGKAAGAYEIAAVLSTTSVRVKKTFPVAISNGSWTATAAQTTLTILFVPGSVVTNTYLLNQPLLDGITKLNEGTPPVPKSQVAESAANAVPGILDPYLTFKHEDVTGTYYEGLDFYQVDDGGQTGLIASICEGGPGTGFSGLATDEGEDIYSPEGGGDPLGGTGHVANHFATGDKVGKAVGAEVFDFSGTQFWQDCNFPASPAFSQKGGSPGGILFASGGSFVNPVVDGNGVIVPGALVAGGGHLGPGTAVLWPSFPSRGPVGGDQGRIYKRTDWYIRIDPDDDFGNKETISYEGIDETPPSYPASWEPNPDGTPHALGKALGVMQYAGDYSRYGPWGGLKNLAPDRDYGTFRVVAPVDGDVVQVWDPVPAIWVSFTARNVPVGATEFAVAPTPHIALAAAINAYVFSTSYVASAGLTLGGQTMVRVESVSPVDSFNNPLYIKTLNPTGFQVTDVILVGSGVGLLTNGSGVMQSSLLAGGTRTGAAIVPPNLTLGMVALGGSALPQGAQLNLTFQAV